MARSFLTHIDLNKNELQNAAIQRLATAPSSPVTGQVYYNTANSAAYYYNGSGWINMGGSVAMGTLSARPAAGSSNANTLFYATDNSLLYVSNGTTWSQVSAFGSGASTAIVIGTTSSTDGTSTSYARADHTHAGPGFGSPSTLSFGGSAANGSATTVSRSDHSHAMPAHDAAAHSAIKISDLAAPAMEVSFGSQRIKDLADPLNAQNAATKNYVDTRSLSNFSAPTGDLSAGSYKITNLAEPTVATDAATKAYVDGVAQGLNVHDAVHVATTGPLTATYTAGTTGADGGTGVGATLTLTATGTLTIDGHLTVLNDRILVKNQVNQIHNGVYYVSTAGATGVQAVLTRATDYDNSIAGELTAGDFIFVDAGSTQANTGWAQTETGTATTPSRGIKIGTDNIAFTQFSGAGTYTASNGVLLTGNNFTFNPALTGGLNNAWDGAAVKLQTNSGLGTSSTGLAVGQGTGITVVGSNVGIDTSVVARKYTTTNPTLTPSSGVVSWTVTHSLGSAVLIQVHITATGEVVEVDMLKSGGTAATLSWNASSTVTAGTYTVVVIG